MHAGADDTNVVVNIAPCDHTIGSEFVEDNNKHVEQKAYHKKKSNTFKKCVVAAGAVVLGGVAIVGGAAYYKSRQHKSTQQPEVKEGNALHELFYDPKITTEQYLVKISTFISLIINGADINALKSMNRCYASPLDIIYCESSIFSTIRLSASTQFISTWGQEGCEGDRKGGPLIFTLMLLLGGYGKIISRYCDSDFGVHSQDDKIRSVFWGLGPGAWIEQHLPLKYLNYANIRCNYQGIDSSDLNDQCSDINEKYLNYSRLWSRDDKGGTCLHRMIREGKIDSPQSLDQATWGFRNTINDVITNECTAGLYALSAKSTPYDVWSKFVYVPGECEPDWVKWVPRKLLVIPTEDTRIAQLSATIQSIFLSMKDRDGKTAYDLIN